MIKYFFIFITLTLTSNLNAQTTISKGMFSPEIKSVSNGQNQYILMKTYNGLSREKRKLAKDFEMLTYPELPLDTSHVDLDDNLFTTELLCLDSVTIKWTKNVGTSNSSISSGLTIDNDGFLYTGERNETDSAITVQKINKGGEIVWLKTFDSLRFVHEIYSDESEILTLLVSYTYFDKIEYDQHHYYQILKINKTNGEIISKLNCYGANHYSLNGFSTPILASHDDHYFYQGDTLIYSRNDSLLMRVVSEHSLSDHRIIKLHGKHLGYYALGQNRNDGLYRLIRNDWAYENGEKYVTLLINPDAKILSITPNELKGISVFYRIGKHLKMIKLNHDLEIKVNTELSVNHIDFELIADISINKSGLITFYGVHQKNKIRTIATISNYEHQD